MPPKKRGLGRGLDALLRIESEAANDTLDGALQVIDIDALAPGRYQPRKRIDDDALAELAASIGSQGIIQPILVRPLGKGRFEIIAGERRWRAARLAGSGSSWGET